MPSKVRAPVIKKKRRRQQSQDSMKMRAARSIRNGGNQGSPVSEWTSTVKGVEEEEE